MYFDTKKKEFKKNGKLSILKTKSVKMNFTNNIHKNDNDIFSFRKRNENINKNVVNEDTVEKRMRGNVLKLSGNLAVL